MPWYDIALIKTKLPIKYELNRDRYGSVNRICMPKKKNPVDVQIKGPVWVSGWGKMDGDIIPDRLQVFDGFMMLPIKKCMTYLPKNVLLLENQLCTVGQTKEESPCEGDSGSPLYWRSMDGAFHLIGLVSHGTSPCYLGDPSVYTRVYSYIDWIKSKKG